MPCLPAPRPGPGKEREVPQSAPHRLALVATACLAVAATGNAALAASGPIVTGPVASLNFAGRAGAPCAAPVRRGSLPGTGPSGALTPPRVFAGIPLNGVADANGDVGLCHYVQMTNAPGGGALFDVFDKVTGSHVPGPRGIYADSLEQLWIAAGAATSPCATVGRGDPIVLYDARADRWLLTQFAYPSPATGPYDLCVAVSTTGDPTGNYFLYQFGDLPAWPDYPKYAVGADAYYLTTRDERLSAFAFDRTAMLAGQPAQMIRFDVDPPVGHVASDGAYPGSFLPADVDGRVPPAALPGLFLFAWDQEMDIAAASDRLEIWEFRPAWTAPATSRFERAQVIDAAAGLGPHALLSCLFVGPTWACIPQPNSTTYIAALPNSLMYRLQYRDFGDHETLLASQTVAVDGNTRATVPMRAIPDASAAGVEATLDVAGEAHALGAVEVCVEVGHPRIGDLQVSLVSPAGTAVVLHDRSGGATRNIATCYDGRTAPAEPLSRFAAENPNGTWRLVARDLAPGATGTLRSASLQVCPKADLCGSAAGVRWWELRRAAGAAAWTLHQQGTHAPQAAGVDDTTWVHRFMGSIAMDGGGNIALGYTVSNHDPSPGQQIWPGLRIAGQAASQSGTGLLEQPERTVMPGLADRPVANAAGRWGDYSAMVVDPVDDCTFWYTGMRVGATGVIDTQIATFTFDADGDGTGDACHADADYDGVDDALDCAPQSASAWAIPGEAAALLVARTGAAARLTWSPPVAPGGVGVAYDAIAAPAPLGFAAGSCVESDDASDTTATDPAPLTAGSARFYLVRGGNVCGEGSAGTVSAGAPRDVRPCP